MKSSSSFVCQNCGAKFPKWIGQCSECNQWGTLVEEIEERGVEGKSKNLPQVRVLKIKDVQKQSGKRLKTKINELDRVLGGGIVPGSVVLFAGEPGIGKSTLLTQLAVKLSEEATKVLYVCGEESPEQVRIRLDRVGNDKKDSLDRFLLFPGTNVDSLIAKTKKIDKETSGNLLLIVDSIQTLTTTDLSGAAGSVGQIRECTQRLIELAKTKQIPVFLVGHVTKEGVLAGPKTIEHSIDTVLYFEGERSGDFRLLRSVKNRFGPTDEVGVFKMMDKGLVEVIDPSAFLLEGGFKSQVGSAYSIVFEGTRPVLVEIQALVTKSFTPMPKRVVNNLDRRRAEMLLAVIQKFLKLPLWDYDIFLNVAGGLKVQEPAADLAVCAAILSSYKNKSLLDKSIFFAEVSLLGETTRVGQSKKREKQAQSLGFKKIFSHQNLRGVGLLKKSAFLK